MTGETPDVPDALRELMWHVHDAELALARRLGVGVTDVLAMQVLAGGATGTVGLGAALRIRSASATALADRLEDAGHLRRVPHATDGRRVLLQLTESARADVIAGLRPLLDMIAAIVDDLEASERLVVHQFLRRATAAISDFAAATPGSVRSSPRSPRTTPSP
ncbi:MAG: MarR family transcriptional regulator [Actinomycetia bacterium]|nr:MarR family transcriptional regulator [Actinomycetes bacterium]